MAETAEQGATLEVKAATVHTELGGGYASMAYIIDAAGTQFVALSNSLWNNNNISWVDLFIVKAGEGFSTLPQYKITPVAKMDQVTLFHSGPDLVISLATHTLGYPSGQARPINTEQARINGIFAITADYPTQHGGEGVVIVPTDGGPPPAQVDYARIKTDTTDVVQKVVGATTDNSLTHQIIGNVQQSLRQALRDDLDKDALLHLLTGPDTDPKAKQYKDALFEFTKNAAANPHQNILLQQDEWGQNLYAHLVAAVKEGCLQALRTTGSPQAREVGVEKEEKS